MAKIGLKNFLYAILTEAQDGTPSYGTPKKPAKAISCSVSIENNDAKLYADDVLAESDTSFQSGTVTMGIDEEDQATMAEMLGHTVDQTSQAMIRNANDVAPYVGFGRIVVSTTFAVTRSNSCTKSSFPNRLRMTTRRAKTLSLLLLKSRVRLRLLPTASGRILRRLTRKRKRRLTLPGCLAKERF